MKKIIFASVLGVVILTLGFFLLDRQDNISNQSTLISASFRTSNGLESKVSNEEGVEIVVIPIDLTADSEFWSFEVSMNTHSVELDQDIMANSSLEVGDGKSYNPVVWEGDPVGGHHRSGVLKFKSISPLPSAVAVKIKGIGGASEREFKWSIK